MKAITIGVGLKSEDKIELKASLAELKELGESYGLDIMASHFQTLEQYNPATLLGSGKVEEVGQLIQDLKLQIVLIDKELGGAQHRNLEKIWNVKVMDRTQLILEIFAQRALSKEGQLQVELAQLLVQSSRMVGAWQGSLSRQGGGIGTLGPGERALEYDRRQIRNRIAFLRKELDRVRTHRDQHRQSRQRKNIPTFALLGYTNVGKSSLLNALAKSEVFVQDQLFATLDPTSRRVFLNEETCAVVTDTVGFIRRLPTHLVEAFKATLEESAEAKALIHVVDLSHPDWEMQSKIVKKLISEFGWESKPVLTVFNKIDQSPLERRFHVKDHPRVFVSAKTGEGLDQLKDLMSTMIHKLKNEYELFIPSDRSDVIFEITRKAKILKKEESRLGTFVLAELDSETVQDFDSMMVKALN